MADVTGSVGAHNKPSASEGPAGNEAPAMPVSSAGQITELRVSGHLMTLEDGLFCIIRQPSEVTAGDTGGLPGVRVSLPPDNDRHPGRVTITSFREDGWLAATSDAALVRVNHGPAQILVTVYQSRDRAGDQAPRLQVLRLSNQTQPTPSPVKSGPASALPVERPQGNAIGPGIMAHIQKTGDVAAPFDTTVGTRGSKLWIEGFALRAPTDIAPADLEYQAVLGRGWLSPWVAEGRYCGSRGMALPLLGLRVRLVGEAAKTHTVSYEASFVDDSAVGPVMNGEACEAESLAPLESIRVTLHPKSSARSTSKASARRSR